MAMTQVETWRDSRKPILAIASLVLLHLAALAACFAPALSTPDANGYSVQARLLATEGRSGFTVESPVQYVGPHWLAAPGNAFYSKYPPGLPAIMSAVWRLLGPNAALAVNPVMASLTLLAVFLLARIWVGAGWGLAVAALMAVNPFANEHALAGDAHTSVAFFLMWGLYALIRWNHALSPAWAAAAGLMLGAIPSMRYAEALLLPGCGLYVLLRLRREPRRWPSLLAFGLGVALPLGAICLRNQLVFGAFWRTGYSLTNEQGGFGLDYFVRHAVPYMRKLLSEGSGPPFALGVVGIALLCAREETRRQGILLASLVVPTLLLYMSYYWPPDPQSMRFLLPTLFLYPIAAVWLLQRVAEGRPRLAWVSGSVLILLTVVWGLPTSLRSMLRQKFPNATLAEVGRVVEQKVPPGSIVIADEIVQQHLDFVGRWRLADASVIAPERPRRAGAPGASDGGPDPMQAGKNAERTQRYSGLTPPERFAAFAEDVGRWAGPGRRVFWIGDADQIDRIARRLAEGAELRTIARIVPERPPGRPEGEGAEGPEGDGGPGMPGSAGPGSGGTRMGPGAGGMMMGVRRLVDGEPLLLVEWTRG